MASFLKSWRRQRFAALQREWLAFCLFFFSE